MDTGLLASGEEAVNSVSEQDGIADQDQLRITAQNPDNNEEIQTSLSVGPNQPDSENIRDTEAKKNTALSQDPVEMMKNKRTAAFFIWESDIDAAKAANHLILRIQPQISSLKSVSDSSEDLWKSHISEYFLIVLLYSSTLDVASTKLERFLSYCTHTLGKHVFVIMTNVADSDYKKKKTDWEKGEFSGCPLIVLNEQESCLEGPPEIGMRKKVEMMKNIFQLTTGGKPFLQNVRLQKAKPIDIGIFSRSDKSDYSWLIKVLQSEYFSDLGVINVNPCYISNSGFQQFKDDVSHCSFGILYHTKNRGRINVTDVTDSLYDEELKYLHDKLGKEKVIVVIDDLQHGSELEKTQILHNQHSIGKFAQEVFLFTSKEKHSDFMPFLKQKKNNVSSLQEKLKPLLSMLKENIESGPSSAQESDGTKHRTGEEII